MIFSFYSYKGGVGRSQLCANVAAYLCHKKNKRVLLLDWDFEAPGLHYYFDEEYHDIKVNGSLELLEDYMAMMLTQDEVTEDHYQTFDPASFVPVLKAEGWKREEERGCVDLIPAGCYNDNYTSRINNFNWFQFYNRLDGKVFIEWLKQQIKSKALDYDYILIDSRTGINDYSGICNLHLPDANIVVMAANSQNMKGCKKLVDQIINHPYTQHEDQYRTKYILPVLSRINVNNPQFDHWADQFVANFQPLMEHWDTGLPTAFSAEIFRDFYLEKTLLEDMPQYSAGENILFHNRTQRIHRSSFAAKFANLAQYLEDLKEGGKIQLEEQIDREAWEYYAQEGEVWYKEGKEGVTRGDVAKAYRKAGDNENAERFGGTVDLYLDEYKDYFVKGEYEEAKKVLLSALPLDVDNIVVYLNLSRVYMKLKEFEKAKESAYIAISIDDNSLAAYKMLGSVYQAMGNFTKALDIFKNTVLVMDPQDKDTFIFMSAIYGKSKEFDLAIASLETAVDIDPNDYQIFNNLGAAYSEKGETDLSIRFFKKAIQLNGNSEDLFYNLGTAYYNSDDFLKAILAYSKAIEINPNSISVYNKIIQSYYKINQPQKAKQYLQELTQLQPNNPNWPLQLARLHRQQKNWEAAKASLNQALQMNQKEVLETLKKACKDEPNNAETHIELGRAYQQLQRWGKALNSYERALKLDPNNTIALNLMGNVYTSKGSTHIAIEYYQKSLAINAKGDYVHLKIGKAYYEIKEFTLAIAHYQKSLAINPNNKKARNNLGVVYYHNGQSQLAVETYLESLTMDEDHEVYNNNIGYLYLMTGELEQALPYLERSLALGLTDFAHRNLGHYYLVKSDSKKAVQHYQQAWEAFADKEEFWQGLEQDFQYLKQYGLTLEDYEDLKGALLTWIEEQEKNQ